MSEELESHFNRVNMSIKDFEEAHAYLAEYREDLSSVVRRALLTAAVVAYARPFKRGNGAEAASRLPVDVRTVLNAEQMGLHHRLIDLRDRGIAHSDFSIKPTRRVARQDAVIMAWSKPFDILGVLTDVEPVKDLAWAMHCHCVSAIFALGRRLQENNVTTARNARSELPIGDVALRIPLNTFAPSAPVPQYPDASTGTDDEGAQSTEK